MTSKETKKHEKHVKLAKPNFGKFGRNEVAILGAPCGEIRKLAQQIAIRLSKYSTAFIDEQHSDEGDGKNHVFGKNYLAKPNSEALELEGRLNDYEYRMLFGNHDLILVNGNHFLADEQIAFIHPKKSLEKKLHKLTDVKAIFLSEESSDIPAFLKEHLNELQSVPIFKISDIDSIIAWFTQRIQDKVAPVNGLILAGGRSTRMRQDKSQLNYHGKPQVQYVHEILERFCTEVFLSCRPDQKDNLVDSLNPLEDKFIGLGPFGGILSAFQYDPNSAWLVVACDLPFVNESTIQSLIESRDPSKMATAFRNPENQWPEPLISLWEPKIYPQALQFLGLGYSCPRKTLINSDINLIEPNDFEELTNVNTPEELELAKNRLSQLTS